MTVAGATVPPSAAVKTLGMILDKHLSMEQHVNNVCKAAYYHLHLIRKIRRYLTFAAAKSLVISTILLRLDFANAILIGLPLAQNSKALEGAERSCTGRRSMWQARECHSHPAAASMAPILYSDALNSKSSPSPTSANTALLLPTYHPSSAFVHHFGPVCVSSPRRRSTSASLPLGPLATANAPFQGLLRSSGTPYHGLSSKPSRQRTLAHVLKTIFSVLLFSPPQLFNLVLSLFPFFYLLVFILIACICCKSVIWSSVWDVVKMRFIKWCIIIIIIIIIIINYKRRGVLGYFFNGILYSFIIVCNAAAWKIEIA